MKVHNRPRNGNVLYSEYYLIWMLIFSLTFQLYLHLRWVGVLCCPEVICLRLLEVRQVEVRQVLVRHWHILEHISSTTDSQHYLYAPVTFPSPLRSADCKHMIVPCTRTVHMVCTVSGLRRSNLEHAACQDKNISRE